jgi:hypothetical protein
MIETMRRCPICGTLYTRWDEEMYGPHHCVRQKCGLCSAMVLFKDTIRVKDQFFCKDCASEFNLHGT